MYPDTDSGVPMFSKAILIPVFRMYSSIFISDEIMFERTSPRGAVSENPEVNYHEIGAEKSGRVHRGPNRGQRPVSSNLVAEGERETFSVRLFYRRLHIRSVYGCNFDIFFAEELLDFMYLVHVEDIEVGQDAIQFDIIEPCLLNNRDVFSIERGWAEDLGRDSGKHEIGRFSPVL